MWREDWTIPDLNKADPLLLDLSVSVFPLGKENVRSRSLSAKGACTLEPVKFSKSALGLSENGATKIPLLILISPVVYHKFGVGKSPFSSKSQQLVLVLSNSSDLSHQFAPVPGFNGVVEGKNYRKSPLISWENLWFPVDFPNKTNPLMDFKVRILLDFLYARPTWMEREVTTDTCKAWSTSPHLICTIKIMSLCRCCCISFATNETWLVVWNRNFMTFHILGTIIPTDFHMFQKG